MNKKLVAAATFLVLFSIFSLTVGYDTITGLASASLSIVMNPVNDAPTVPAPISEPDCRYTARVDLFWYASTDDENDTIKYFIRVGTSSGGTDVLDSSTFDTNYYSVPISPGSTHYWSVKACDNNTVPWAHCSDWSPEGSFSVSEQEGATTEVPAIPPPPEKVVPPKAACRSEEALAMIAEAEGAVQGKRTADASALLSTAMELARECLAKGLTAECEAVLSAAQPAGERLASKTIKAASALAETPENFSEALGLAELGLTKEGMLKSQQNQWEINLLLYQAQIEGGDAARQRLLAEALRLQEESLDTMPEIEVILEVSDGARTTRQGLEQALSHAATPEAELLLNIISSRAASGVVVERKLTGYRVTNVGITDRNVLRARLELGFEAQAELKDLLLVEVIPKGLVPSIDEIMFPGRQPMVLQHSPPVFAWAFSTAKAGEPKRVSYIIKKKIDEIGSFTLLGKDMVPERVLLLFDVNVTVTDESREVFQSEDVVAEIKLTKVVGPKNTNVDVTISIKDSNNSIIATKHEVLAVETKATLIKRLKVPITAKAGNYIFHVTAAYEENFWEGSDSFKVIGKPLEALVLLALIFLLALMVSFFILVWSRIMRHIQRPVVSR